MIGRSLAALALATVAACAPAERPHPAGPSSGSLVPTATPRGADVSSVTTTAVSVTGAAFPAPGAGLTLSFPPAALATTTDVTVTSIANMARGAIGPAYRLGPEGTTFAAPVTLEFKGPASYPVGTSLAGVGVAYQDAAGFWHPVQPVARNFAANTVSVTTTHFSDWALVWQGGSAAAEGPIRLTQTYGPDFVATGTATVYFLSDDPYDTRYGLTGTLTVQDATIQVGSATCVPEPRTVTLPMNAAEAHKDPLELRWGVGAFWTLSCSDGTHPVLPAIFDTMGINPPACPGDYSAGQVVSSTQLAGSYVKDCGLDGTVSATWDLRSCWESQTCSTGVDCRAGLTACSAGVQSCVDAGPILDPVPCGTALAGTCDGSGACVMP